MGLCRTGAWAHIDFTEQAEQHRRHFVKTLNLHMAENGAAGTAWDAQADDELWQAVPRFAYQPPGWSHFFAHHGLSLGLLLGWFAFATGLAMLAARRLTRV
jgi:ABC-2 type transport system permease protein